MEEPRQQREQVDQEIHDLELKASEVRVRIETLVQRTIEESQLDLPAKYAELTADGKAYDPGEMDWDGVANQIKELREKIQRLGNVNVESIGEQDEMEKRRLFLQTQMDGSCRLQGSAPTTDQRDQRRERRAVRADVQCRPRTFPGDVPQTVRRREGGYLSGNGA